MKTINYLLLLIVVTLLPSYSIEENNSRTTPHYTAYKSASMKPVFGFKQTYADPVFKNLTMIEMPGSFGVESDLGKILRAYRFKNITDAVEDRYNLPHFLLLAMVTKESNGVDLLPNGLGDGGYGLCHQQPLLAHEFGLKTYKNCKAMVCNGKDKRSCRDKQGNKLNHALDLKKLIQEKNFDRKLLIAFDDRLHPIKNIDAVGRMISCYMDGPRISGMGPLRTAVCRYAGRYNYQQYWQSVSYYIRLFEDEKFMERVEREFNALNGDLVINGHPGNFDEYIRVSALQNFNYGLAEYKALPKYLPKNSEIVKKTYKNFME